MARAMRAPHPLAEIPLTKDNDTIPKSPSSGDLSMRALVPHNSAVTAEGAASGEPLRSEDDTALMMSLISVMPHERADSQFSVTSPDRRSDASSSAVRHESWFRSHRPDSSAFGGSAAGGRSESQDGTRFRRDGGGDGGVSGGGKCSRGLDFLGTTDSVRDLFHLPYTSDAVTVGLHRVGKTLVLDGNLDEMLAAPAAKAPVPESPSPSSAPETAGCANNHDSNTVVGGGDEEGRWVIVGRGGKPQSGEGTGRRGGQKFPPTSTASNAGAGAGAAASTATDPRTEPAHRRGDWSFSRGSWPALGAPNAVPAIAASASPVGGDAAMLATRNPESSSGILSIMPNRPRSQSSGARPPEPAGFRRSFQWELAGMHLMLGSSLPVCSTSEHPQVSVRLHDGNEDLSLCTCLDYYLDNIMESVPELALCMREKGYIQGCRVVSTEDIPYLGTMLRKAAAKHDTAAAGVAGPQTDADKPVPMFEPDVVELNATMLLRFLQENCSREGGTYLLHRSEGAAHVQLYDVSALSRQRNRRWKWLLAMLCYRFAVRISHHTRQPWGRGGGDGGGRGSSSASAAGSDGPVDVSHGPGPEVLRQLQRRQRQLLENSLELLKELAELGGGGHETICASVQEHIADTYLVHGTYDALPGRSDGSTGAGDAAEKLRGRPRREQVAGAEPVVSGDEAESRRAPWMVDADGKVWTSPPQLRPRLVGGKGKKKGNRRVDRQRKSEAGRNNATFGHLGEGGGSGGNSHPGSVRLGVCGGSDGAAKLIDAGGLTELQKEDNLDKAQDHLTSGIAILRGVMARREAAVAGNGSGESDVVIVGESKLPVAIMRQQQNPWLADDEDEEEEEVEQRSKNVGRAGGHDEASRGDRRDGAAARRRRRRWSRDESEDPATALAVVSEQLWGLQQKLVRTYMAAAGARLGRAFPDPSLATTTLSVNNEPGAGSKGGSGGRGSNRGSRGEETGRGATAGGMAGATPGTARSEDGPDEETRMELVRRALDSLCAAWEHLVEAKGTLDRRYAAVFAGVDGSEGAGDGGVGDDRSTDGSEAAPSERGHTTNRQEERAKKLGPLWKGSLSEALAHSVQESSNSGDLSDERGISHAVANNSVGVPPHVVNTTVTATAGSARLHDIDNDVLERLAWTRAARRQLECLQAELFELCGDVAHACVSLRARGTVTAAHGDSGTTASSTISSAEAQRSLPVRLQKLLSSTSPPLNLDDLDVCQGLHGRVWNALNGAIHQGNTSPSAGGKRGRGPTKSRMQSDSFAAEILNVPDGIDESTISTARPTGVDAVPRGDPHLLAETCVHNLAKAGRVPGDSMAWSLCLAAEVCYEQALLGIDRIDSDFSPADAIAAGAGVRSERFRDGQIRDAWDTEFSGVPKAQARVRKKLGDASNELGKLMAHCAGALVQWPLPKSRELWDAPADKRGEQSTSDLARDGAVTSPAAPIALHPGPACAACVACAEGKFRRSLAQFRAIQDARNTALLLCNLASIERLKPRAFDRLKNACPTLKLPAARVVGDKSSGGKEGGAANQRGAAAAVELCNEAHAALGRREEDERTWDHTSGELAMAFLCLGVERRQELLATLQPRDGNPGPNGGLLLSTPPTVAQVRGVIGPLEQALKIYTDMNNAHQAAACHYQIGQYYSKILPVYIGYHFATDSSGSPSLHGGATGRAGSGAKNSAGGLRDFSFPSSSTLQIAKAWDVGQRGARHFLAARAYFAPFEHGPTSVILALDLCDLYLSLATLGITATSGGGTPSETTKGAESSPLAPANAVPDGDRGVSVPIPSFSGSRGTEEMVLGGRVESTIFAGGGRAREDRNEGAGADHRRRPTVVVRFRCLEGALLSLLETHSVFADAGADLSAAAAASATAQPQQQRLRQLLESVTERLPRVLQALVRTSVELESSSPSPPTAAFKTMYMASLQVVRSGGDGAQEMLTRLFMQYGAIRGDGSSEQT